MEQLTLEQAAAQHARRSCVTHAELKRTCEEVDNISFQAGAEWQKEQYKGLKLTFEELAHCLRNADDRPYERELIRKALELLQD